MDGETISEWEFVRFVKYDNNNKKAGAGEYGGYVTVVHVHVAYLYYCIQMYMSLSVHEVGHQLSSKTIHFVTSYFLSYFK